MPTLTVIMPVYTEVDVVAAAVEEVRLHVLALVPGSVLFVVNDGSTDGTKEVLDSISAANPQNINVMHKENGGHGSALVRGLDLATTDFVFLMDSDMQIPLQEFSTAWIFIPSVDAVFGIRRQRQDPSSRLVLSKALHGCIGLLFGVQIQDANCPFKILRRSIFTDLRPYIDERTLTPSIFLALMAARRGYSFKSLEVAHRARKNGLSKIRHLKLLKFCLRAFFQMLRFRGRLIHEAY